MPIYEWECVKHGRFESISPVVTDVESVQCGRKLGKSNRLCKRMATRVPSLVTMKPDTMWSGVDTQHGHITSQSQLDRIRKQKNFVTLGSRAEVEQMKDEAVNARKDWDRQLDEQTQQVFKEQFTGTGIVDSFGELRPEATRPI